MESLAIQATVRVRQTFHSISRAEQLGLVRFGGDSTSVTHIAAPTTLLLVSGKLCDSKTLGELRDATNDTHTHSMYLSAYKADPASYNPDNKKGGGYWLFDQKMPAAAPFNGTTTYTAELGDACATADVQLQSSLGLNSLTSASEQACQGRAGANRTTPVHNPTTSNGDLLGYVIHTFSVELLPSSHPCLGQLIPLQCGSSATVTTG